MLRAKFTSIKQTLIYGNEMERSVPIRQAICVGIPLHCRPSGQNRDICKLHSGPMYPLMPGERVGDPGRVLVGGGGGTDS